MRSFLHPFFMQKKAARQLTEQLYVELVQQLGIPV